MSRGGAPIAIEAPPDEVVQLSDRAVAVEVVGPVGHAGTLPCLVFDNNTKHVNNNNNNNNNNT